MESPTPADLIAAATSGQPGWSEPWGGPMGVARAAVAAQEQLNDLSQQIAALRAAALQHELEHRSLAEVARELDVTKQALSRASRADRLPIQTW